jgi:23S rRNA (adenine2503-C2)-methyltransferase
MSEKKLLTSWTRAELENYLRRSRQPSYRAGQIFRWVYQAGKSQPGEFTDLPLELRQQLEADFIINPLQLKEKSVLRMERSNIFLSFWMTILLRRS